MYALNTITHDKWLNTIACGHVGRDRYWESTATKCQLSELAANKAPEVRVVLTHHPVHEPPDQRMSVKNLSKSLSIAKLLKRGAVASSLAQPSQGYARTAYVVLSGHTHCQFPKHGELPAMAPQGRRRHEPLHDGQVQLTTGTLSQRSVDDDKHEHVFQVVRFYEDVTNNQMVIGRVTFTRSSGTGAFMPLYLNIGSTEERMVLPV